MTGGAPGGLVGRVVIVTGGTSGVGRAACLALARAGARVVAVGRNEEGLEETLAMIEALGAGPGSALPLALDVCSEPDMEAMATRTLEAFGTIDALVAAAGTLRGAGGWPRRLHEMSLREWDEVIRTNLTGVFLSNRAVLRTMIPRRRGDIINVSSTSGVKGLAFDSAYCASKFGVIGLSEALAEEVRHQGVRVQVLLPGAVDTPMWRDNDAIPHLDPALPVERVADAILEMLALPGDAVVRDALLTPFLAGRGAAARRASGGLP